MRAAVEMDAQHPSPVVDGQFVERNAVEDAGIAHDGVDTAELLDRGIDDCLPAFGAVHRVVRRHGGSARSTDLADDLVGDARVGALAMHGPAEVVDYDGRTPTRQLEGVQPAESAARSGDD